MPSGRFSNRFSVPSGRVARTINPETILGAPSSVLEGGAFDFSLTIRSDLI